MKGKTYRQITHKLRVSRGPGKPELVSTRPCKKDKYGNRTYTDSDENPTLVTFDEDCILDDLPFWLKIGALKEYTPPRRRQKVDVTEEVPDGEVTS